VGFLYKIEVKIASPDCAPGKLSKLQEDPFRHQSLKEPVLDVPFFLQAMMNRMSVSYHKYGSFFDMFPERKTGYENCLQRLKKYEETGNTEWLIDAANYIMMEFMAPSHIWAHFRATSSEESPGSVMVDGSIDHGTDGQGGRRILNSDHREERD
jgi:hypothetical protein